MTTQTMPTLIDQLGEAALAAREATREAHEAIKDLRAAAKEAREAEASLRRAMQATAGELAREALAEAIDARMHQLGLASAQAKRIGADLGVQVEQAIREGLDRYLGDTNEALARIAHAAGVPPVVLRRHVEPA